MSSRALQLAVRDRLRSVLTLSAEECDVMPDGRPKPAAGEQFVSVHDGGWNAEDVDAGLLEREAVLVTVTRRLGYAALDTWGAEVSAKLTEGLKDVARRVITAVHMSYAVLQTANATITADYNGFVEPLRFQGAGPVQLQRDEWFHGDGGGTGSHADAGLSLTLTFGGCLRAQNLTTIS